MRLPCFSCSYTCFAAAGLPPLGIRITESGECITYFPGNDAIELRPGSEFAHTLIELTLELWQGLAADLETVPGLLYGDKLGDGSHGDMGVFSRWEPVLRSIYHGLPICDPTD